MNTDTADSMAIPDAQDFDSRTPEIDEKPCANAGCSKVVEALRLVGGRECVHGLELDNEARVHEEVDLKDADDLIPVTNVDGALLFDLVAGKPQFDRERILIDLLEKPNT